MTLDEALDKAKHFPTAPFNDKTFYTKYHEEVEELIREIFKELNKD